MTENEAIKALTVERNIIESMIDYNHDFEPQNPCERLNERLESINLAIKTLEEVQQYREIGTVEECREAVEKQNSKEYESNRTEWKTKFMSKFTKKL